MKNFLKNGARVLYVQIAVLASVLLVSGTAMAATAGSISTWTTNAINMPIPEGYSTSVEYNGYVYELGGGNNTITDAVYYAKLNSDGSVGAWTTSPNHLPDLTAYATSVAYNGYVYVMGGGGTAAARDTVYYAKLNSDGSVGAWTTSPNTLPQPRSNATSVLANGYVYVFAGYDDSYNNANTVYYAKLNSDGSVGAWATSPNHLSQSIAYASSVTANGYAYVFGGQGSVSELDTVYYAKLNSDGSVGAWTTSPNTLPDQLGETSAVTLNGYAYVMGGVDSSVNLSYAVYYAKLNSDGSVGAWTTSPNSIPDGPRDATAVTYNDYIYYLGGYGVDNVRTDAIYYARVTSPATVTPSASPASSTTTSSGAKAPDTGYGAPHSNLALTLMASVALISLVAGSVLLRRI